MAVWPSSIKNPAYPITKIPQFSTNIIEYGNNVEQRIALWSGVRYTFKLNWKILLQTDIDTIRKFFIDRKGSFDSFHWPSPEESYLSPAWQASNLYELNDIIRPTTINERSYICTVAGTSGSSEPTWPTTEGGTVVDGGVTWQENSYLVRFATDLINIEYFLYRLYSFKGVTFIQVAA